MEIIEQELNRLKEEFKKVQELLNQKVQEIEQLKVLNYQINGAIIELETIKKLSSENQNLNIS